MYRTLLVVYVVAALVSISVGDEAVPAQNLLTSPCPELFQYESVDKPGEWTGTLILKPEYDLKGAWIRLVFDKEIKDLTVNDKFEIKKDDDKKQVRLQDRNRILNADSETILKITLTYEGTAAPSLIEYRLNARTICPQANIDRQDIFLGDTKSDYYYPQIQADIPPQQLPFECGVSKASHPHPWQASIYVRVGKDEYYNCEATLISQNHVITAAHCVTFRNQTAVIPRAFLTVYLGPDGSSKDAVRSLVSDIQVHDGYQIGSLLDDVAILKLAKPIQISDALRPICVTGTKEENNTKAVLIGHEQEKEGHIGKSSQSEIRVLNFEDCIKMDPKIEDVLTFQIYCVAYKSDDKNCVGDSGSGLITIGSDEKSSLEGMVTLGVRLQNKQQCDDKSVVLVTDISRYVSWIRKFIL